MAIYLDFASTTPVEPEILKEMQKIEEKWFYNPSSLYTKGMEAKRLLDGARQKVAELLHVRKDEIIFTASGTEADNMAIFGTVKASRVKVPHIVISAFEHPAILEAAAALESEGALVTKIMPNAEGLISPEDVASALTPDTVLVSVMYANNEIGTISPLKEIAKVIRSYRQKLGRNELVEYPYFHTDASQAPNYLDINREKLGADLMTLDGSKIYGPKGVGVLYVRDGVALAPVIVGGGQERGMRAGTENLSRIIGFASALELSVQKRESESARLLALREYFFEELLKQFGAKGCINGSRENRLPNNVNFCFPGNDGEFLVIALDEAGIMCSAASACSNLKDVAGSYVIEMIGNRRCGGSSLRFTLGRDTKKSDIVKTIQVLQKIVKI